MSERMKRLLCICLLTGFVLAGCSGDGTTLGPDGTPPGEEEAKDDDQPPVSSVTLGQLSQEIFTPSCAFSGGHGGGNPAANMSLAADRIAGNIWI